MFIRVMINIYGIAHSFTQTPLGKTKSDIDSKADEIIFTHLKKSGVVHSALSEEKPYVSSPRYSTDHS